MRHLSLSPDTRIVFANAIDEGLVSHIRLAPNKNLGVVVAGNLWTLDPQTSAEGLPEYAANLAQSLLSMAKNI